MENDLEYEMNNPTCCKCGRELDPAKVVPLELNSTTLTWHREEDDAVPEEESQGVWDFGPACAKKALKANAKTDYSKWADF